MDSLRRGLVGRAHDLETIRVYFEEAPVRGGALLVLGEAGVGKTALLDAVTAAFADSGHRVLRAAGVEFEADISYSGLHQLLFPVHEEFDALPPLHRDALKAALGFDQGTPPDRLLLSNSVLLLLRHIAEHIAVRLIVDDAHWLDRASGAVLGFVARRLVGSDVGLLTAARPGEGVFPERGSMPVHELLPLDTEASGALLDSHFPELAPRVRRRLLDEAAGNPLALLELPAALSGPQLAAMATLPPVLPLGQRLHAVFLTRVQALPEATRAVLLLAVLDGTGDLAVLRAIGPVDDLAAAERDRLVTVDTATNRITFGHPLIGAAVVAAATSVELRQAHRRVAKVLEDHSERRAWHLAEATITADEDVAAMLEEAARSTLTRGDAVGAVNALIRAADLTPERRHRSRRLAEAAYIAAELTGELGSASQLLDRARTLAGEGQSLHAAAAAALLLINSGGEVGTAFRLLMGAVQTGDHGYDANDIALVEALHTLLLFCWFSGTTEFWPTLFDAVGRLRPAPPAVLSVCCRTFADPARTGVAAAPELDALLRKLATEPDPTMIIRVGSASVYLDRLADVREPSWRVVRQGREGGGPVRRHLGALMHLCLDDYLSGRWDEASALADEGMQVCEEHGYRFYRWYFAYVHAVLAARRGKFETSRALCDEVVNWSALRGARGAELFAQHPRGLSAIGQGDFEAAYQQIIVFNPPGTLASHVPHALWAALDLVEAAVRTNRQVEARAHVRAMREAEIAKLSSRMALLVACAESLVDGDDEFAVEHLEAAVGVPEARTWPFDLARARLLLGERLRRTKLTARSRVWLRSALDTFDQLGAEPWSARAATELRAAGEPVAQQNTASLLTPQEQEIAELAASGLTNKQIGERLFLSHRTIGAHLYQIFPKLGITSRAALRDALAAQNR
ncbi:LuxR family transcriptional regulator [Kutzneria buriramensis]|uniref:Regulatory LuxR family protein n=1 Tax=Kutzneria buriramensis TaxID=1045776 RepID=A0A3E0GXX6_9PSEU|nr:LuxR family transcriptional regulator [Kutzneria buriramensis]REH33084.1 regulatory LuxR family protein [Kutzneria buriramensis]